MPGIHKPYVYVGMLLTTFGFHIEDCDLGSLNYHHEGSPKVWYIVPGEEGKKLEQLFHKNTKELCNLYIRHESIIVPPSYLQKHGIKFARVSIKMFSPISFSIFLKLIIFPDFLLSDHTKPRRVCCDTAGKLSFRF